jgi:membrane protease YdiL (CAAX protease family)
LARQVIVLRIAAFLGLTVALGLPLAVVLVLPTALLSDGNANATSIAGSVALYGGILGAIALWGQQVRRQVRPLRACGLGGVGFGRSLAAGVGLALVSMAALFGLELALGWAVWQPDPITPLMAGTIALNVVLLGVGVGFLEELFFRGWLLAELRAGWRSRPLAPAWAAFHCNWIFAVSHFLKPWDVIRETWPQFLGLLVLGQLLVAARHCGLGQPLQARRRETPRGSLAVPMGLHGGWVAAITGVNLTGAIAYPGTVPAWITGVGGNPLAGAIGVIFLVVVYGVVRAWAEISMKEANGHQ